MKKTFQLAFAIALGLAVLITSPAQSILINTASAQTDTTAEAAEPTGETTTEEGTEEGKKKKKEGEEEPDC